MLIQLLIRRSMGSEMSPAHSFAVTWKLYSWNVEPSKPGLDVSEDPCTHIVPSRRQTVNPGSVELRNMTIKLAWSTVLTLQAELVMEFVVNAIGDNVPVLSGSDTLRVSTTSWTLEYCTSTL